VPQELVAKFVIPYIRALVAIELYRRGYSQVKIAKLLGISQPMVSRYIAEGVEYQIEKLSSVGIPREEAMAVANMLTEVASRGRKQDFIRILASYGNTILMRGYLCSKHRELVPDIPLDCSMCTKLFSQPHDPLIEELKQAYEILRNCSKAYELIPEVGANIVVALPDAVSLREIVGFSGRIIRVGNRIEAVGEPLYGGSRHTAQILLIVRKRHHGIRAAMVIRYSNTCVEKLRRNGMTVLDTGPHENLEALYKDLEQVVKASTARPDAIADRGGMGIEPVIYIFGLSAIEVVKKALICVEETN